MKLLFLVNGQAQSAAAGRAQAFTQRLPGQWAIQTRYRPAQKGRGVLPFVRSALRFRPDVIYVVDTAYTGVLGGCIAKKRTGCRLVTDTGDMAYELARSTGAYSRTQLALINWIEQVAIKRSDSMVVRGSYHKTLLEGKGTRGVVFIPDGVDTEVVGPVDSTALRTELGLAGSLVLGLVGTMSWSARHRMCYGWDVIEALGSLKNAAVKALLIGDGDGRSVLEERAKQLGVTDRVVFTGSLPYCELPRYLSAIDVCVSTQSNDLVGKVRTTGKLPLYLACGRYVIATAAGEANRVLPGVGCLLPYEGVKDDKHPSRLAEHVKRILAEPRLLDTAAKGRQVAKDNFEYKMLARRVEGLCRGFVQGKEKPPLKAAI